MAKYLVSTTEVYRVDTEDEATKIIEEAKEESVCTLGKYTSERKTAKKKTEVDIYWKVSLTKNFNDIKDPNSIIDVHYGVE